MATTREAWLIDACGPLSEIIRRAGAECPPVAVSIGFPRSRASHRIGECWDGRLASDGRPAIFVSPTIANPLRVLDVLLHEMIHAAVGTQHGHRGRFVTVARACGLVGKPTATVAGEDLARRLNTVSESLGSLPHAALTVGVTARPGSRLRLYECACRIKIRAATDSLDVTCNACGELFARKF